MDIDNSNSVWMFTTAIVYGCSQQLLYMDVHTAYLWWVFADDSSLVHSIIHMCQVFLVLHMQILHLVQIRNQCRAQDHRSGPQECHLSRPTWIHESVNKVMNASKIVSSFHQLLYQLIKFYKKWKNMLICIVHQLAFNQLYSHKNNLLKNRIYKHQQFLQYVIIFYFTFPLRPQWDIRPQQSFATRFCLWLRPEPHPTIAPSLSARPSLFVATSSLAVLASFFQVVSISVAICF